MGSNTESSAQEKQSSSMSLVQGWIHENLRLLNLMLIAIAILLMFMVLLYGTSLKSVTIIVDGKYRTVDTRQTDLQRLLDEQAITIGPHDRVLAVKNRPLRHGDTVEVQRIVPITVTMLGQQNTIYTAKRTVREAIDASHIVIDHDDKLVPSGDTPIETGMKVRVIHVRTMFVAQKTIVPFEVVTKKDSRLEKGVQKTVRPGRDGEIVKKIVKTFEDGEMVSMKVLDESVLAMKEDQIVAIGTSKPVTVASVPVRDLDVLKRSGLEFAVKRKLANVTLTAYSADYQSTKKSKNSAGYGVTASGTRVKEGQTIAVDPKVIPIGYWVYIEGVGFRRAEDKGSAVKGNKIDVYFDTHKEAVHFGRQKGRTVYVIGPEKPSAR